MVSNRYVLWAVPLSVISSWKKIKAMGVTSQLLVMALRTSDKLVSRCYDLCASFSFHTSRT
jgi:hypothetical protein